MMELVNCSNCHMLLQLPTCATSIRCHGCQAIIRIADPRSALPYPPSSSSYIHGHYNNYYPPPPFAPYPYNHGRKKAVIVGISYRNSENELKGSINDAKCMKFMLTNRFNFPESSIRMLTDEENDPYRIPTKLNIEMAMFWLIQGCESGDSLVFYFSGHGSQQKNETGDEIDGFDETLYPLDFKTAGIIVDDDINATLVRPLPAGAKLHTIVDACHSGTALDLPFLYRMDSRSGRRAWEDHRPPSGTWKGTSGGEAISFSGCHDHQTAVETDALSKDTSTSAMTFAFIQAIEKGRGTTYGTILDEMSSTLQWLSLNESKPTLQEPQLSSNIQFDVYMKSFSL